MKRRPRIYYSALISQRVIEANGGKLIERFTKPEQFGATIGLRYRIVLDDGI